MVTVKKPIKIVQSHSTDNGEINIKKRELIAELPTVNIEMLKEGKICIISLNDLNEKHCLIFKCRYQRDSMLFSSYKNNNNNNNDCNKNYDESNNDNDSDEHHNDNHSNSTDDNNHNAMNDINNNDLIAIFENGSKWALFKCPITDLKSMDYNTDLSNTDSVDMWLSRLLGGEVTWIKSSAQKISL